MKFKFLLFAFTFVSAVYANPNQGQKQEKVELNLTKSETTDFVFGGLTESDWLRYTELMNGPQGRWTPNEDPTFILGQWARTDAERRRFAEIQVEVEKARAERAIAFSLAYSKAWNRLYPDLDVINARKLSDLRFVSDTAKLTNINKSQTLPWDDGLIAGDRLIIIVSPNCDKCGHYYQEALTVVRKALGIGLDIFFDGYTDDEIQLWAFNHQVPLSELRQRIITLNPTGAALRSQLTLAHGKSEAVFYRRRGNQYSEVQI